jgi:GPN-loop GTPase
VKGKAEEEGSGKGEELADTIGNLSIGPGRTNFKKKPVIIIVIGMAGASNPFAPCFVEAGMF